MLNPNRPVMNLDDSPKSRKDIEEMLKRMDSMDENGYPVDEKKDGDKSKVKKVTA